MYEVKKVQSELNEAIKTIKTLKNQLNEINLLNAKLLYVNKVFKSRNLSESQKAKVISSLDKAENTKEAKLVYESLIAGLNKNDSSVKKQNIRENLGFASKAAGVARSKSTPIVEDETIKRFQKLANIN